MLMTVLFTVLVVAFSKDATMVAVREPLEVSAVGWGLPFTSKDKYLLA